MLVVESAVGSADRCCCFFVVVALVVVVVVVHYHISNVKEREKLRKQSCKETPKIVLNVLVM